MVCETPPLYIYILLFAHDEAFCFGVLGKKKTGGFVSSRRLAGHDVIGRYSRPAVLSFLTVCQHDNGLDSGNAFFLFALSCRLLLPEKA